MAHTIQNNFKALKSEFRSDTGKNPDDNIELYIQYFNARMLDRIMQYNHIILHEMSNKIDHLPGAISMKMADMITQLKKDKVL